MFRYPQYNPAPKNKQKSNGGKRQESTKYATEN